MKILWITPLLLILSYHTIHSQSQEEYNQYSFYQKRPLSPRPLDAMADLTNDLGVCVLRVIAAGGTIGNIAFSPFGLMAVSVLLYEGSSGYSALQIKQSLNLPWEVLAVRIGVRDLNRYLKTYFKSDGFLNGLTMSREEVCLRPQFKRVLRLYGFDDPNSFLIDSCPETIIPSLLPMQPMSVTTHGIVVTEITPTSQVIQVLKNITKTSTSNISTVTTGLPAKVTYMGDASFTISNVDTNTNIPMNSQTDMMIVDFETQPNVKPIESSTGQVETTVLINEQDTKISNEIGFTDRKPGWSETIATSSTTPIASDDILMVAATVTQMSTNHASSVMDLQIDKINNSESGTTDHTEAPTEQLFESMITVDMPHTSSATLNDKTVLTNDVYVPSTKIMLDNTVKSTESTHDTTIETQPNSTIDVKIKTINDTYMFIKNTDEVMTPTATNKVMINDDESTTNMNIVDNTTDTIPFLQPTSDHSNDVTTSIETMSTIPIQVIDQTTPSMEYSESFLNDGISVTVNENVISTTDVPSAMANLSNTTENEIIKEAESNQYYQIASLENKSARSMESNDNLPTFNVEFVVGKEYLRTDCNKTRKRTIIKPDKILTEYPKNSGVSITLKESKKRRKRHLEQYQRYNPNRNQWSNDGYKMYGTPHGWLDTSSTAFESTNLFNTDYRRIPFFTYTAVLPFGFIFELKSQVIEIPLDDPKYTLMILMPNHPDGISELLLLLPSMSLRNIHNYLKPTAVHATIPMFKYTAKVDLTSALQQIGIRDVFYRYRADLTFMSPDARLFVNSVQQVVSVTAKKYNTPPVYEIQRKYVKQDFVVSRPFVYFVMDIHTKVSLIAGVITDPLASPIWI